MILKHLVKALPVVGAAIAMLALVASTATAKEEPALGYTQFAGCPSPEENSEVAACFRSEINGGHFQMGSKDVPITKPLTISGGITEPGGKFVFNSSGGLSKARQQVPGGIIGLTGLDWLVDFLNIEQLKLFATTELAGPVGNPLVDPLSLPIKVRLENTILGNNCYVGSTSNPISLNLTRGTTSPPLPNTPISGKEFAIEVGTPFRLLLNDGILVDNAFAAPGANGCQLNLGLIHIGIDGLVNSQAGLPSPAGTNEAVQNADAEAAATELVYP